MTSRKKLRTYIGKYREVVIYLTKNYYHYHIYMYRPRLLLFGCACAGVVLLKEFQQLFTEQESRRQELTMAEKLFDLPITMYSDLSEVDKELRNLTKVYELYEAQRVSHMTNVCCVCVGTFDFIDGM